MYKLLEHQRIPIEHLVARCVKQHGMVINHYMGTGKTITGLVFLNNFPKHTKVIILPRGLESIWIADAKKLNINYNDFTFIHNENLIDFEKYSKILKNSICVWDEAHFVSELAENILNTENGKKRIISFIDLMYSTKKILLLSGTIYKSPLDLIYLVNIAAGKEESVLPFDVKKYENKYYKKSAIDLFYRKIFKQILIINPINVLPKDFIKQLPYEKSDNFMEFLYTLISNKIFSDVISKLTRIPVIDSNKKVYDPDRYKEILLKLSYSLQIKSLEKILFGFLVTHIVKLIIKTVKVYYQENFTYIRLDVKKLKNDNIDRYISFFNYKYSKQNNKDYPTYSEKTIKVKYTKQQLTLLVKFMGIPENLSYKELTDLEIYETIREAELLNDVYSIKSHFLNKGRIIGNLYDTPEKFKRVVDTYLLNFHEQTVVYSSFYEKGIKLFEKYLKLKGIKFTTLHQDIPTQGKIQILEDFKNKKINLLLLHPDFYIGVSISGCKALHILEPIKSNVIIEQLKTRVIRYNSHISLPENERNVRIYQYSCSLKYDIETITFSKEYAKQWYLNNTDSNNIIKLLNMFKEHISPDDIILNRNNIIGNFKRDFDLAINELSIHNDKTPPKLQCSIWGPDSEETNDLEKCYKKLNL